ncbi:metallophosphoesterase [Phenylobacterium sp. SCN 70-31]|uniref:metallophosphoesterase family protein n=1 Tax=Phenylobacterium sp. SCN 70-31 TaxID=1660129 RepID=UPI00086CDFA4|nr:metallophosphoesterase [Phenylobacterium sp. SCN 70-31]ODT89169.1 MAG: phosphohydrolase [Phenylobacterium sp. SCN 70-31]
MRILLVSDLHYALKQYDWTLTAAPDFDVVVIAGDHLDISSPLDGSIQVVVILKHLQRIARATRLIVSSGNHDLDRRNGQGERVASWMDWVRRMGIAADGDAVEIGDTLLTVCPWWDGPLSREAVGAQLARDAARRPEAGRWIWVYHAPPEGSPTSWDGRRDWGDGELSAWIDAYRPDMVLAGHIHQAPFRPEGSWVDRIGDTWVFNCGRQIGPVPPHIVIDTQARAAAWFSLAGTEAVRLDRPLLRPLESLDAPPEWLADWGRGPIRDRDPIPA